MRGKIYGKGIEVIALSILLGTTITVVSFAILGKGTLIYFFEPNPIIWSIEIIMCLFGIFIGIMIWKRTVDDIINNK